MPLTTCVRQLDNDAQSQPFGTVKNIGAQKDSS